MSSREPRAVIFGCAGPSLGDDERHFFRDADPLGFILFRRNCPEPAQVRCLVEDLRMAVGRSAPILIDQEGGRVRRLQPPHWRAYPAAAVAGAAGGEAAWLMGRLIADDLAALGITVDCAPVLDLAIAGADPVIGDRAWGSSPAAVSELGRRFAEGLLAGGVLPVIKHLPGIGRGLVDSHFALPSADAPRAELEANDFAPFRALAGMPWGMTGHILLRAIDPDRPSTLSAKVIGDVIRACIGFDGVLISDDLSMQALPGSLAERAHGSLEAGCDAALHCNGNLEEMREIAAAIGSLGPDAVRRVAAGEARREGSAQPFERAAAEARFDALLGPGVKA